MNTINPALSARLEQAGAKLLDAIFAEAELEASPAIQAFKRGEHKTAPEALLETIGGGRGLAEIITEGMRVSSARQAALAEYIATRRVIEASGQ